MSTSRLLTAYLPRPARPATSRPPPPIWREAAEAFADEVTSDPMGSSVARVGGRADHPLLAVIGHIDEIALVVSHVSEKGFLHVNGSGGWDPQVLVGQRVEVLSRAGAVRGVIGRKPIHVLEGDERKKAVELKGLHVDIGVTRRGRGPPARPGGRSGRDHRRALELRGAGSSRARSTTGSACTWRWRWRGA